MTEFLRKMNLQLFAEEGEAPESGAESGNGEDTKTPTVEELVARLAAVEAESESRKNAINKLMRENGDLNKLYRDKLTAEEKAKLEQAEKEAKYADMEKRLAIYDAKTRYLKMGMSEEMADEIAGYEVAGDFVKVTDTFQKHLETVRKTAISDYVAGRQKPAAGNGPDESGDTAAEALAKKIGSSAPQKKLNSEALSKWA